MFNHLPTHDKNFKSEAHDVKIRLFLSEYLKGSDWSWIFVKFLQFDVLQPFLYLSEKVQVCSSLYENWSILVRIFEGVRLVWEPQFLVSFWSLLFKRLQYLWQNFPAWGSWHENWPFSSRLWKDQIDQGNRIFGQFCIFWPATI